MKTNTATGDKCKCAMPQLRAEDATMPYRRCGGCGRLRYALDIGVLRQAVCRDADPAVPVGADAQPLMVETLPAVARQYFM